MIWPTTITRLGGQLDKTMFRRTTMVGEREDNNNGRGRRENGASLARGATQETTAMWQYNKNTFIR